MVRRLDLSPRPRTDWALATSAVRRAVFFYANLALGEPLVVDLLRFELSGLRGVKTHLRLSRPSDGQIMADLITDSLATDPGA